MSSFGASNLPAFQNPKFDLPAGMPLNVPQQMVKVDEAGSKKREVAKMADGGVGTTSGLAPTMVIFNKAQTPFPTVIQGLDFNGLAGYLNAYEMGLYRFVVRMWALMRRRDSHLLSVSQKRLKRVTRNDWEIIPVDSTPEATAQAEFLSDFYSGIPGFKKSLGHLLLALGNGYAGCEICWQPGLGPEAQVAAELLNVRADYFDEAGGEMKVYPDAWSATGMTIPENKFVIHRADDALMIASSILFVMKQIALGQWNDFCDRFGMPGMVGVAPQGSSQASRDALQKVVENWVATMATVLPPGYDIKTVAAAVSGSMLPSENLVNYCETSMSILWAGGNLSTKSESGSGTLAGGAQRDQEIELSQDDADALAETLDAQLSTPAVKFQFGQPLLCKFHFKTAKAIDLAAAIQVDDVLINNFGLKYAESDVRAKYGVRKPEPDEVVVTPRAPPTDPKMPAVPSLRAAQSGTDGTALKNLGLALTEGMPLADVERLVAQHLAQGRAAMDTLLAPLEALVKDADSFEHIKSGLAKLKLPSKQLQGVVEQLVARAYASGGEKVIRTAIETHAAGGGK